VSFGSLCVCSVIHDFSRRISRIIFTVLLASLVGCTRNVGYLSIASEKYITPSNYDYSKVEKVFSTGESHQLVFYIWDVEPLASIRDAINEAVRKVDGDFMTDIKITETEVGVILFAKKTIRVEGIVYKLPKAGVR
jgi:hypothetical protein